jgi:hypothetical protein
MALPFWRPLSAGAALALLSSCAGSQPVAPSLLPQVDVSKSRSFAYTGKAQTFTVPVGVKAVKIVASGASGPSGEYHYGGNGGLVKATIPVMPGEKLAIFVGGEGGAAAYGTNGAGGYNGGGDGGQVTSSYFIGGDGGGGASDVRQGGTSLSDRVVIAAGGGGGGSSFIEKSATHVKDLAGGAPSGNGKITISW